MHFMPFTAPVLALVVQDTFYILNSDGLKYQRYKVKFKMHFYSEIKVH